MPLASRPPSPPLLSAPLPPPLSHNLHLAVYFYPFNSSFLSPALLTAHVGRQMKKSCANPHVTRVHAHIVAQKRSMKECKKGSGSHGVCSGETVVTYFFCGEEIPYRRTMKSHSLTLGHFKEQLRKKGNYRYYFKKASDEFECGAVFEEVSDDGSLLPTYEGKILGKVERME
ncbi:hypothetical protein INR49_016040 [Caranx melampygus]|nr:hypothetical protein INR49_016040 [Caranx melampygus]